MFWPNVGQRYLEVFGQVVSAETKAPGRARRIGFATPGGKGRPRKLMQGGL